MNGLNFCSIGKFSAIPNMDAILSNIDIFDKKSQRLSHAHRRFVQESHQEPISLIGTGIEEILDLILRDRFRALSFLFFLPENVFGNGRSLSDVVEKPFVAPETPRQGGGRLVFQVG
jgi:hypothetical protein